MRKSVAFALICACLIRTGAAKEYYFHNRQGDDANPGTREEPFKTLERMNQLDLQRGDAVYFARGTSYYGFVRLTIPAEVAGLNEAANKPVRVGNYGKGPLPRFCNPEWTRHFGNAFVVDGEHVILDGLYFHNTVLCLKPMNSQSRTVFVLRKNNVHNIVIRHNIFVTANGLQVFGLGGVHRWPQDFNQPHSHNLFWSIDGSTEDPSGSPLKEGEIIADPMFVDIENRDLRLREESPAIDAGADLGYQLDFENKRLPCGDRPEIGAFEHCEDQGEQK